MFLDGETVKMRVLLAVLSVAIGLSWNSAAGRAADAAQGEAAEKTPELAVLERFVGVWESVATSRPGKGEQPRKTTGVNTIKWVLNGQFLQDTGRESDNTEHLGTWTWDREQKAYRAWYFFSEGTVVELNADWNEPKQLLVWTSDVGDGLTFVGQHHFIDPDTYEWKAQIKDANGQIHVDMESRHKRRK